MDVKIISMEMIKPSTPTPDHLKTFKLCTLDQLIPAAYAPIVFYYPNNYGSSHVLEILAVLKRSLSETLTRFYPLAGTLKDDLTIICDDEGACFTTAKADNNYCLSDFLANPDLKLVAKFLPCGLEAISPVVTNIQVTLFECGGIAIGVCISHRILDGAALGTFMKSWASFASPCKENSCVYPDFSASSLFPANDVRLRDDSVAMWGSLFKKGQFVTKRFLFDGLATANLKDKAGVGPTRVEAVSAFIWKCAVQSRQAVSCSRKPSLVTHLVNLRKRATPNFAESSLGNLIWIATTRITEAEVHNIGFQCLANKVRNSISKVDGDYVKKLRGGQGPNVMHKCLKEIEELGSQRVDHYGFSSWCRLGFYDVNFGWGKPMWVSSIDASGPFFMNLVILNDTRCGNGIEAWVTLDEEQMLVLENNQEFRAFASLNPIPLDTNN